MKGILKPALFCIAAMLSASAMVAQEAADKNYYQVNTYVNPVLPGDHPDPTVLKVGDDFYHCGSSFHFNPYLPVYHSKDLVHWEIISRVVPSEKANGWVADRPSGGIWQGAITYFYGSYWIYFSSNGQWFCKASTPYGPWSEATQVKTNAVTGNLGYDNSIFIDDDGKPYMVIKNGQKVNRIQALGKDGQLTDTVINLDWINANLQYSWAEGPVMCKRNGYYFYFPAGDVTGGQYVLRSKTLTSDSTQWERLGDFFKPVTDPNAGFRRPNHISAPFQLSDGTWWTVGQSYEKYTDDDWAGTGRQTSLFPVTWEDNRPWGMAPTTQPIQRPALPQSGILWRSACSDDFEKSTLNLCWHFLNRKSPAHYSLTERKGWLKLTPDTIRTHVVQKETDHYYSMLTKVDFAATDTADKAGLYLTNGNQHVTVQLYSGYEGGKMILFKMDTAIRKLPNTFGNIVWLKIERYGHQLTAYCSGDGKKWSSLGAPINAANLDKTQPNFNSWVGTSMGMFTEGKPAYFDAFVCKDGFSSMPAIGYSNYFGVEKTTWKNAPAVTYITSNAGWFMISGVDAGTAEAPAKAVQVTVSSDAGGAADIWLDDLGGAGKKIATVIIQSSGDDWKTLTVPVKNVYGHHDVFVHFLPTKPRGVYIKNIQFIR